MNIYLYSKYKPQKLNLDAHFKQETKDIIVLGLGLGYELELLIQQNTDKHFVVIEKDKDFANYINKSLLSANVDFVFDQEYKNYQFSNLSEIWVNQNLIMCDFNFYKEVNSFISSKYIHQTSKNIIVYEWPTIAKDCVDAFEKCGYNVLYLKSNIVEKDIIKYSPNFVFTVNFNDNIAAVCEKLNTKYISWTVDTPCYSLYSKEAYLSSSYLFIYDEVIADTLKKNGVNNVYYLPVAANIDRLDQITSYTGNLYRKQVSFVGSCCANNEYLTLIKDRVSLNTQNAIENIIKLQSSALHYIIKDLITDELISTIEKESNINLKLKNSVKFSKRDKLSFFLGRYHSYKERQEYLEGISKLYDVIIYGDDGWLTGENPHIQKCYYGVTDHYREMPKVFKDSFININITRSFVESGLPMRIFDVLGSKGFLVTNDKPDIHKLFNIHKDLVVYRDLDDLLEIIEYYLHHEDERMEIVRNGYETVKKYHTYNHRIKKILEIIGE